jgi:hypothetical protein
MSYGPLKTHAVGAHRAGFGHYGNLATSPTGGHRFAALGDIGPTSIMIGPGGQWQVSTGSNATPQSIGDQIMNWFGQATVLPGVPNALIAIGGLFVLFSGRRRHR